MCQKLTHDQIIFLMYQNLYELAVDMLHLNLNMIVATKYSKLYNLHVVG